MTAVPFDLPGFEVVRIEQTSAQLAITLQANCPAAACPMCGEISRSVHSYYSRRPKDLPITDQAVALLLCVRRFRCMNERCQRRIFAERFPDVLPAYARRTARLTQALRVVEFALGGEPGSRLLRKLRMPIGPDTLLRIMRQLPPATPTAPRVLGVDDWAYCKGRRYGTMLVDLERHRPIDLLPDRTADKLAAWLRLHPGIEIVARDRSTEYARGITEGAPQTLQVADRWHLLKNLRETVQRLLRSRYKGLRSLPELSGAPRASADRRGRFRRSEAEEKRSQASRSERLARYEQVQEMRRSGGTITGIARELGMSRGGIRRYYWAESFPERAAYSRPKSILDPYLDYLEERHREGCENASQLWREIQRQGFPGTYRQVAGWMQNHRTKPAPTSPTKKRRRTSSGAVQESRPAPLPSARELSWLLMRDPLALNETESSALGRIRQEPWVEKVYRLAQLFVVMIRKRLPSVLDKWIAESRASGLKCLKDFAAGLQQDYKAVRAALETEWSSGQTEGQINRLKLLKRQMYGRAGFDLLRSRVLHAA